MTELPGVVSNTAENPRTNRSAVLLRAESQSVKQLQPRRLVGHKHAAKPVRRGAHRADQLPRPRLTSRLALVDSNWSRSRGVHHSPAAQEAPALLLPLLLLRVGRVTFAALGLSTVSEREHHDRAPAVRRARVLRICTRQTEHDQRSATANGAETLCAGGNFKPTT